MDTIPRPFGCEAAYWFPVDIDVCDSIETTNSDGDLHGSYDEAGGGNLVLHVRSGDIFVNPVHNEYGQVSGAGRWGMGLSETRRVVVEVFPFFRILVTTLHNGHDMMVNCHSRSSPCPLDHRRVTGASRFIASISSNKWHGPATHQTCQGRCLCNSTTVQVAPTGRLEFVCRKMVKVQPV